MNPGLGKLDSQSHWPWIRNWLFCTSVGFGNRSEAGGGWSLNGGSSVPHSTGFLLRFPSIPYCLNKRFAGRELENAVPGAEDRGGRSRWPRGSFWHVLATLSRRDADRPPKQLQCGTISWRAATAAEGWPLKILERPCRTIATAHADKLRVTQLFPHKNIQELCSGSK